VLQVDQKSRLYNAGRPAKQGISPALLPWPTSHTSGGTRRSRAPRGTVIWPCCVLRWPQKPFGPGYGAAVTHTDMARTRRAGARARSERRTRCHISDVCARSSPCGTGLRLSQRIVPKNVHRHEVAEESRFARQPIATCGPAGQCRAASVRLRPKVVEAGW